MATQATSQSPMATALATLPEAAQRLRQDTESAKARSQRCDGMAAAVDVALAAEAASPQRPQKE
jgi:hypothetical protein